MADGTGGDQGQERFRKFLKIFEDLSEAAANAAAVAKKQIEVTNKSIQISNLLFESITKDRDGLIAAIDDLIAEVQGLREDFRIMAKQGGLPVQLSALLSGGRRSR